jgi:ribosomal protein S18 acetylase RimI-like enzyme
MAIFESISRIAVYYSRHGFRETTHRVVLATKRALFASRMVVFYCDLARQTPCATAIPSSLQIYRLRGEAEFDPNDLERITNFWNPKQAQRNIKERFAKGASLWLVRSGDNLAGYGWTLQGCTVEPYYFPLAPGDVHLFDFHVFPQYRGQGVNPFLVNKILQELAMTGGGRAFIEAAEWNESQLLSLRKTSFQRLGRARSLTMFGHKFVSWVEDKTVQRAQSETEQREGVRNIASPHER